VTPRRLPPIHPSANISTVSRTPEATTPGTCFTISSCRPFAPSSAAPTPGPGGRKYGRSKLDWFQEFLELPHGITSHDTFGRLVARIDPQQFHDFFSRWVRELAVSLQGKTVAIDGEHGYLVKVLTA